MNLELKENQLNKMKEARSEKSYRDIELLNFHIKVYQLLISSRKSEIERKALSRILLWKEKKLCSKYYIDSWSSILENGVEEYNKRVLSKDSKESIALMQNTPFSFLMKILK